VAYQSEIELRVKVLDQELKQLEQRLEKIQNPFDVAGKRKRTRAQTAAVRAQKAEAELIRQSIEDLDRLRETKERKRLQTNLRRVRYLRDQRIRAEREVQAVASRQAATRREAVGSAVIGGAFPLLFGQGAGAAVGGGLGGAAGGALGGQFGFGLSLVGTAVGQAVDTITRQLNDLAASLKTPSQALIALEEAGIKVADSSKQQIAQLEEAGRVYDAQTVLFAEISARLGTDAVNQLNALNDASNDLQQEFSDLKGQIVSDLLPAVLLATRAFADIISILNRIEVPQALAQLALGLAFVPGGGPGGFVVRGAGEAVQALAPGTTPDRSQAQEQQTKLDRATQNRIELLNQERDLLTLNNNLLDDAVYNEQRRAIENRFIKEEQNLILSGKGTEEKVTELILQKERDLKKLADDRATAQERVNKEKQRELERAAREAERAAKEAARAQEQRINQLNSALVGAAQTENELIRIRREVLELEKGALAAIEQRLETINNERSNEAIILDIKYSRLLADAKSNKEADILYDTYVKQTTILEEQRKLDLRRAEQRKRQLEVEREILRVQTQLATAAVGRDIGRQIEDVQRGLSSPFGGEDAERLDLLVSQERRRIDALREVNEQINEQTRLREAAAPGERAEFDIRIQGLQDQLTLYERLLPQLDAVEQAQLRQNQLMERYGFLANELSTAMSSAVQAVVTGTGTVEEAFATMFQNIGRAFIDMATQILAQKLFMTVLGALGGGGGLNFAGGSAASGLNAANLMGGVGPIPGFRASGGPVNANQPYIVGERGPELFMPSSSGMVLSNSDTRDKLEQQDAAMRGNEATRQQLIKQQNTMTTNRIREVERTSQAMLASPDPIDVRYESSVINNVEYVTAEQHRKGMAQAAERGRQLTLQALQGSVKTRKKVGL